MVKPWDAESIPRVPKARDGESTSGVGSPSRKGGSGDLARENCGFEKAVDGFLVQFRFISSVSFIGMSEEISLILVTFEHLTTHIYGIQLFRSLTESRWHLEESYF